MTNVTRSVVLAYALCLVLDLGAAVPGSYTSVVSAGGARLPAASTAHILARVHYIHHGLSILAPYRPAVAGKVKMPLFSQYDLQTRSAETASYQFGDGTTVKMNQRTEVLLVSEHVTYVRHGEVAQWVRAGTVHRVVSAAALAASFGTAYDVKVVGTTATFVVLRGTLRVSNVAGSVVIKRDQETSARPHLRPSRPRHVDAQAVFAWTDQIPTPDLGEDVALDSDGAHIVRFSSQRADSRWHVGHVNDGLLSLGWETARGHTANQSVVIDLTPARLYRLFEVIIDPASSGGDPSSMDLRNFQILVSASSSAPQDFTTVFSGKCAKEKKLQVFRLPVPVLARYVELLAVDNYGSRTRIAVAELEAVANVAALAYPSSVVLDRRGDMYVADTGNHRIQELSPHGIPIAVYGTKGDRALQFRAPDGLALDRRGIIYVADTHNNRIQKLSPQGKSLAVWGKKGNGPGQYSLPEAVALDRAGNIYVADAGNNRVQKLSPSGKPIAAWGTPGNGPGQLSNPQGIAIDDHGNIYVSDYGNARIQKLSPLGQPLAQWGGPGKRPGQFSQPEGIAVDGRGNIYVADTGNHRIQKVSVDGKWLAVGPDPRDIKSITPSDVAVDARGNVYVTDYANSHVVKLSGNLRVRQVYGVFGTVPQLLAYPWGMAVGPRGTVYVTDPLNARIQERSASGPVLAIFGRRAFLSPHRQFRLGQFVWPSGIAVDRRGTVYVADPVLRVVEALTDRGPTTIIQTRSAPHWITVDTRGSLYFLDVHNDIEKLSATGKLLRTFGQQLSLNRPQGIAIDGKGNIYVVDTGNKRIVKLSATGELVGTFGTPARFSQPEGIALDARGNIYVSDTDANLVQKLSPEGRLLATFGATLQLNRPRGLTVDAQGDIYVADTENDRVVKLASSGSIIAVWE